MFRPMIAPQCLITTYTHYIYYVSVTINIFVQGPYVNALERNESDRFSAPKINANASSQRKNEQLKISQIVVTPYFRNRSATVPCEATAFAV